MTSAESQKILIAPKFGDAHCIAAVKHLEDVAAAREAAAKCRHKKCRYCLGKSEWAVEMIGASVTCATALEQTTPFAIALWGWELRRYWRRGENERDMLCLPVN